MHFKDYFKNQFKNDLSQFFIKNKNLFNMGLFNIFKYFLILSPIVIGLLMKFYNKIEDFPIINSVEIKSSSINKVCSVLKNLEFLKFHPCVKEINYIENKRIDNVKYDIYEIREEAEILLGLYKFQTKNKIYVEKVDDCTIKTKVDMKILHFWEAQFRNSFYVIESKENKNIFTFGEEGKISGIPYIIVLVREYTDFYHRILLEKIRIFIESMK